VTAHPLPAGTPVTVDVNGEYEVSGIVQDPVGAEEPGRDFEATGWYIVVPDDLDRHRMECPPHTVRVRSTP
jgi:hypothetical protein